MDLIRNSFKQALAEDRLQIGLWSSLCSNIAAEIVGDSGFDWILLDTEHSPNEVPGLLAQLQALQRSPISPVVRPAWNDAVLIKRVLDVGAQSVLIPYIQNAEEAARAVASTRYPPAGIRGVAASSRASRYGRIAEYLKKANDEICVLVQVETLAALTELEAIASVDGVDGVFIGPSDLSASFGLIGQPAHPDVQAEIESAVHRIARTGRAAGILTGNEAEARRYIEWGCKFVAVGSDVGLLAGGASVLASKFKTNQA
jgi:4-hydroxy-2-oxoheptanedioate aldolase